MRAHVSSYNKKYLLLIHLTAFEQCSFAYWFGPVIDFALPVLLTQSSTCQTFWMYTLYPFWQSLFDVPRFGIVFCVCVLCGKLISYSFKTNHLRWTLCMCLLVTSSTFDHLFILNPFHRQHIAHKWQKNNALNKIQFTEPI